MPIHPKKKPTAPPTPPPQQDEEDIGDKQDFNFRRLAEELAEELARAGFEDEVLRHLLTK